MFGRLASAKPNLPIYKIEARRQWGGTCFQHALANVIALDRYIKLSGEIPAYLSNHDVFPSVKPIVPTFGMSFKPFFNYVRLHTSNPLFIVDGVDCRYIHQCTRMVEAGKCRYLNIVYTFFGFSPLSWSTYGHAVVITLVAPHNGEPYIAYMDSNNATLWAVNTSLYEYALRSTLHHVTELSPRLLNNTFGSSTRTRTRVYSSASHHNSI